MRVKKIVGFLKKCLPVYALVLYFFSFLSLIFYVLSRSSNAVADAFDATVGYALRRATAFVSDLVPVSLAELIIIVSPLIVAGIVFLAVRALRRGRGIRFLSGFLSVFFAFLSLYSLTLGIGYHKTEIEKNLDLPGREVNAESLAETFLQLMEECNALAEELTLDADGFSVMPMDFRTLSDEINVAFDRLCADIPSLEIKNFHSDAKRVMLSRQMSALEITGVYTFFTGEANVNVHYPDYSVPYTLAHELAHQRGIARENEANFIAHLVCIRSDNPYIRYSGYMNMLEYVASAISRTDKELYRELYAGLNANIVSEMKAYSDFYRNNKKPFWSKLSDTVNDTYLKAQGTEGIVSYGLVVRLAVAYYAE